MQPGLHGLQRRPHAPVPVNPGEPNARACADSYLRRVHGVVYRSVHDAVPDGAAVHRRH
ncbi:hypothetical protein CBM2637_A190071 [Cupriavidus taiwanensis]|nr:hypothetical protein CBM2637_A190071 [Cupriavidus taiwanensis]SPA50453.1 protein of unknown function [Cupriavidus taiwanensis]